MGKMDGVGSPASHNTNYLGSGYSQSSSAANPIANSPDHFHSLEDPAPPPAYSTIADDGTLNRVAPLRSNTGNLMESLPVASTQAAAINYAATHALERDFAGAGAGAPRPFQESIDKFINSTTFSAYQKQGIQDYYQKYGVPIGIAHQLEALADHRFEFVMDNSPNTSSTQSLVAMSNEILQKVELLRHIPNQGIAIRVASSFNRPEVFKLDEKHPDQIFNDIKKFLQGVMPARQEVAPLKNIYDAVVGDAVVSNTKTIPYVFSARDLTGNKGKLSGLTKEARAQAKNLTKTLVNRPSDMAPTAFFPQSPIKASNEVIEKLDTVAKRVGVISPYEIEHATIIEGQSELFPYSIGIHTQASLLAPVSAFWDEIDEGKIFSKVELEQHLALPLTDQQYSNYFEKTLNRQARKFKRAEDEADAQPRYNASKLAGVTAHVLEFATSTQALEMDPSPHLQSMLHKFRTHPDWSPEVEAGINRYCEQKNVPIGMGMHLIDAVGRHHEINLDNSGSMILRSDQENESSSHLQRDLYGKLYDPQEHLHPSRLTEGKNTARRIGETLAFIPTKGVTFSPLNTDSSREIQTFNSSNDPNFLSNYNAAVNAVKLKGGTPLNEMTVGMKARAASRDCPTSGTIISDGGPTSNTAAYKPVALRPEGTIVDSPPVREMMFHLTNRDPQKLGITAAQCTNNPKATVWTNFGDNVCTNVNAVDDMPNEMGQVHAKQGSNFPYNEHIYTLALVLGSSNPLFDKLDEEGIYSKVDMECLLGRSMSGREYDQYYDQAYARQCDPESESVKSDPIEVLQNWGARRSAAAQLPAPSVGRSAFSKLLNSSSNSSQEAAGSKSTATGGISGNFGAASNDEQTKPEKKESRLKRFFK